VTSGPGAAAARAAVAQAQIPSHWQPDSENLTAWLLTWPARDSEGLEPPSQGRGQCASNWSDSELQVELERELTGRLPEPGSSSHRVGVTVGNSSSSSCGNDDLNRPDRLNQ
jgi:hypothetical protein